MAEQRLMLILVGLTLTMGLATVGLLGYLPSLSEPGVVIEAYQATFHPTGLLEETYTYQIRQDGLRFLFRTWDAPLSATSLEIPYIEPLTIDAAPNAIGYAKDYLGSLQIEAPFQDDPSVRSTIAALAERSEVGSFRPDRYPPGTYTVAFTFQIHPPLERDAEWAHLNLQLANRHLPYHSVEVIFTNANYIHAIYPHPPSFQVTRDQNQIVVTGSSRENELVEMEMLIDRDAVNGLMGFPRSVPNIEATTVSANQLGTIQFYGALVSQYVGQIFVLLFPLLFYMLYARYGRERDYTVPRYLSVVPNPSRKPWVVNQIFEDTALDFDDNGLYATMLDLHRRRKLRINASGETLRITIVDTEVTDRYERQVMEFLSALAQNNVVDSAILQAATIRIRQGDAEGRMLARTWGTQLTALTTSVDKQVASEFIVSGRRRVLPLLILGIGLLAAIIIQLVTTPWHPAPLIVALLTTVIVLLQVGITYLFPPSLFGRWKGDAYKEKLEWDAFTRHLSDYARLQQYAPEDVSTWGDWLVYGTALGVGDTVSKAMRTLQIDVPEAYFFPLMPLYFYPFIWRRWIWWGRRIWGRWWGCPITRARTLVSYTHARAYALYVWSDT
jgi:uncharacterized membrane protein